MGNPTLLQVAKSYRSATGIIITQDLIKKSGILQTMYFVKSSNGAYDIADVAATLPSGEFRKINAGITPSDMDSEMLQIDLFPFSALHQVDKAIAEKYKGGLNQYIKDKSPGYAEGLGQGFAAQCIYGWGSDANGFEGLRQIAIKNSKVVDTYSSGTGNTYSCILAVKWDRNVCTGLFDETDMKAGKIFVPVIENNGKVVWVADPNDATKKKPVYQFATESFFGMKVLSISNVAVLLGVENVTNYKPTAADLDAILDMVKAEEDGSTFLYMNRTSRGLIDDLKTEKLQLGAKDTEFEARLKTFHGIPIMIDENITQTEARTT